MGKEVPAIIWPVGGRRIVGILSIICVFGFGAAIVYAGYIRAGYMYYLVFTFLWFLALFHAGYAYSHAREHTREAVDNVT
jgi:TM2 domain-containing membrane protein YozV